MTTRRGDWDIVETVNELPRLIHTMVRRQAFDQMHVADRAALAQAHGGILAGALRRLRPWFAKAATGGVGLDDAASAISACEGVVEALSSAMPDSCVRLRLSELEIAFRSFRKRMEPRIRAQADPGTEADLASLSALA
jgi:hypothetical protein